MWNLIPWKKTESIAAGTMTEPFEREFSRIRDDFDSLLHRVWNSSSILSDMSHPNRWGFDVDETETHHVVRVEAPGFEVGDFNVTVSGNQLIVKAERKESQNGKNGSGFRYGHYQRVLSLPDGVQAEEIEANYHSGVLELKFPKGKEAQNTKRINVKAA